MPLTPEQKLARRSFLGGSDAAAVVGRSKYRTALDVYIDKVYPNERQEETNDYAEAGTMIEPAVREWTAARLGVAVTLPTEALVSATHDFIGGNVDGMLADGRVLEIKCIFDPARVRELDELGASQPISDHYVQVMHYLFVTGAPAAVLAYFYRGKLILFDVERDEDYIDLLIREEEGFWNDHVLARVEPTAESVESRARALKARFPRDTGTMIESSSPLVIERAQKVIAARAATKSAKVREDDAVNGLRELVGDALGFDLGPLGKITARTQHRRGIDADALRKAHPDLATKFTRTTTSRPLLVKLTGVDNGDDE